MTIRVNGSGTAWHQDDLAAACAAGPDGIVVPKVNSADEVRSLVASMERHGAPEGHPPVGDAGDAGGGARRGVNIASASARLAVLVLGTNDLVKELGARHVPGREPLLTSLSLALLAARRSGVAILDGVYNDVKDLDGFRGRSAGRGVTWASTARP